MLEAFGCAFISIIIMKTQLGLLLHNNVENKKRKLWECLAEKLALQVLYSAS